MKQFQSSSQLKDAARALLLGKYKSAISVLVTAELIIATMNMMATFFLDVSSISGWILLEAITLILGIFSGILMLGQTVFYLNIACGQPYRVTDLFVGFKRHTNKAISVQFVILILSWLPILPSRLLWYGFLLTRSAMTFMLCCLFLVFGCMLSLWFYLRYSQSFFLILDFPQLTSPEALRHSIRLMKGHKGRLFYLWVSFLPLMLLGVLSFGVGLLFILPYLHMTSTLFYLDLVKKQSHNFYAEV